MSKKDTQQALVPRLRFPEFRDGSGWPSVRLGHLAERVTTRNTDESVTRVLTNSAEHGVLNQRDYFDKDIATKGNLDGYYVVESGDFVYNPRISTAAPVGPLSRNHVDQGVMSPLYTVVRFNRADTDFYAHYFKSTSWHSYLKSVSSTGARHDRMSITNADFMRMPVPNPHPSEQQKIADCLGSLDDLIAAQRRKLAALRDHKKGLMQQLFPREGETRPRLRFPEFEKGPDWKVVPLGRLLARDPQYGANASAVPFSEGLPAYIRITDINDDGRYLPQGRVSVDMEVTEDDYLQKGDIVLARTGASVGKSYRYRPDDGRLVFAGFLIRVRPNPAKLESRFLGVFLSTSRYWDWVHITSARSGQPGINGREFASMPLPIPPDGDSQAEQQRIADCLSALDTLITAQAEKLDALHSHKRGLMQQLFPSPEDATV